MANILLYTFRGRSFFLFLAAADLQAHNDLATESPIYTENTCINLTVRCTNVTQWTCSLSTQTQTHTHKHTYTHTTKYNSAGVVTGLQSQVCAAVVTLSVLGGQGQVVALAAVQDGLQLAAGSGAVALRHVAVRAHGAHQVGGHAVPVVPGHQARVVAAFHRRGDAPGHAGCCGTSKGTRMF